MTRFCRMHYHYIIRYDMETDILNSLAVGCLLSHSCPVLSTVVTEQVLFEVHKVEAAWVSIFLLQTYSITSYNHGFYSNLFGQDVTAGNCIPKILTDSNKANHSENPQKAKDPGWMQNLSTHHSSLCQDHAYAEQRQCHSVNEKWEHS